MNIKTLLVDLDGVVLRRADYFSSRAKELYPEANHDAIMSFFTDGAYAAAARGEIGLIKAVENVIREWNVPVTAHELIEAWFQGENDIDETFLRQIKQIREKSAKCIIVTDHSAYRKNDVWENVGMKNHFDGIIASADLGAMKDSLEFFERTLKTLNIADPCTVGYIDDDPKNIRIAKSCGIDGIVYKDITSLTSYVEE